ncbi:MAG TPA: 4Fe-4S dicluster domain-containing protein [Rhodocyclaceae bacterium]
MLDLPPMTGRKIIPLHPAPDPGRRRFLQWMGASLALAGAACGPPREEIHPYVKSPRDLVPGQPAFYASTLLRQGYGLGVLVECNMGRPTKIEGNPAHPASLGGSDPFMQAAVLDVWDPDRSNTPWRDGQIATWEAARSFLAERAAALAARGGAGLRVLTGSMTSPTLIAQWRSLQRRFPAARRHCYEPLHDDGGREAARLAFGRPLDLVARLDRAEVVLCVGADPLGEGPARAAHARQFAQLRRRTDRPSRLHVVDVAATLTGANADRRISLAPAAAERLLWRVAAALGIAGGAAPPGDAWESGVADELRRHRGAGLVLTGRCLSPATRALAHRMNEVLGNAGRTADVIAPVEFEPQPHVESLAGLCEDMRAGRVDTLLILGGNPAYDAPADAGFADAMAAVRHVVHAGLYRDETALLAAWHLPLAHELEYWGDGRAFDGTLSVVQPTMQPLYGGRSPRAILAMLDAGAPVSDYDAVRQALGMHAPRGGEAEEAAWRRALREGVVAGSAAAPLALRATRSIAPPEWEEAPLTVVFTPDPSAGDGSHANNAWLQELPRPLTSIVWDNAALLAPATARSLGVGNGDVAEIAVGGRSVLAPVWLLPGQAEGTVALPLGYGRTAAGRVGNGIGFDAYRVKSAGFAAPGSLRRTGEGHALVQRQPETSMEGRPLARRVSVDAAGRREPVERKAPAESLYPDYDYPVYAWAMSIDLNACIGCGACTVACQAENNIPVVGKEEVGRGRAMHWIRIDRWFDDARPEGPMQFQPVPCMQCENAPCEAVCPVGATVHDSEGINVQVYNRCIGTRYCSNNCPYKVRRFNFLQYSNTEVESLKALQNPEVTVRRRGVMEKCNYCLQRITRARIAAEEAGRRIADGEVVTACEAACPTRAIVFGDLNTPGSRVNAAKDSPLDYAMLGELNTRPRTTYVARVVEGESK